MIKNLLFFKQESLFFRDKNVCFFKLVYDRYINFYFSIKYCASFQTIIIVFLGKRNLPNNEKKRKTTTDLISSMQKQQTHVLNFSLKPFITNSLIFVCLCSDNEVVYFGSNKD